jgi:seryl-tRNA synthetase
MSMLDIKKIRKDPEFFKQKLGTRGVKAEEIDEIIALDAKRRELLQKSETLKAERNATSKKIGEAKKNHAPAEEVIKHMREIGGEIKRLDEQLEENDKTLEDKLLHLPNVPADDVPVGPDESYNREEYKVGKIADLGFEPKHHWEIGEKLGILDFDRAAKN